MGVIVHPSKPKGQPAGVQFGVERARSFGKRSKNARENKMAEGGHVVARESQSMIEAAKGELKILPAVFLLQMSEKAETGAGGISRDRR